MRLILFAIFLFSGCLGKWVRPNLFLMEEKYEIIKRDSRYILGFEGQEPIPFVDRDIDAYEKQRKKFSIEPKSQEYLVYTIKTGEILEPETHWEEEALQNGVQSTGFFNLLRTMYLLEDWEGAREFLRKLFSKHPPEKDKIQKMVTFLKNQSRFEELVLVLDIVSEYENFSLESRIEIAEYFLSVGDLENAKRQYERILSTYSFHKPALLGMLRVSVYEEKWDSGIQYFRALNALGYLPEDAYYYAIWVHYSLGEFEEAYQLFNQTPPKKKKEKEVLELGRALRFSLSKSPEKTETPASLEANNPISESIQKDIYRRILNGN
jgi:tetratricopeptide (TPR) repeat protein